MYLGVAYALIGLLFVFRAGALSIRYNAWTTRLRERYPQVNPPPTPEWRSRNTKIMTVMFRIVGAFFMLMSFIYLLPSIGNKLH